MKKQLYQMDYEIHSSVKILYPYLQTADGLSLWIADDVTISPEKIYTFILDNESYQARLTHFQNNRSVRFEYLPEHPSDEDDPSFFELSLEVNELTQTIFLKVKDYSEFDDIEEPKMIWDVLINKLKHVVGG